MMRIVLKSIACAVVMFVMVCFLPVEAKAEKKIGVLVFTKEKHYAETLNGIMDRLKKEGFADPGVKFLIENAEGSKAKVAAITQKFSTSKLDMIIALGTTPAVMLLKDIKDVPVVFSMVYDPVESNIAQGWESSGNNTTGSSNKFPMSHIMKTLKNFAQVKKLGVLYQPGEKNSEKQLQGLQAEQNNFQIKVTPIPVTNKEEVATILSQAVNVVDALYLAGSSILGETVPTIVDIAAKAKIITMTNLEERVEKGVLLGVCADSYDVGVLAGERAAKVLKGAKPSSLSIGVVKKLDVIINMKTATAGQIQIPPAFLKSAKKVIQ
jgi:putative ABC transport system substrate-binding protein